MNYLLASLFFLINFCSFSQHDTLVITTHISVDSIFNLNDKLDFSKVNDTVFTMTVERNPEVTVNDIRIYSGKRTYEIKLSPNPPADFPAEWTVRDPKNPVTLMMSVESGECVSIKASGSAVNILSTLIVYGLDYELIYDESCGVSAVKKRSKSKIAK